MGILFFLEAGCLERAVLTDILRLWYTITDLLRAIVPYSFRGEHYG